MLWFHQPQHMSRPRSRPGRHYVSHRHRTCTSTAENRAAGLTSGTRDASLELRDASLSSRPAARPRASGRSPSFQVVVQQSIVTSKMAYGECMCIASIQCCFAPCGLFCRLYAALLWWHAPYICCTSIHWKRVQGL
jgi:hypothetical protein